MDLDIKSTEEIKAQRGMEYDAYVEENYSSDEFSNSEMCMDCIAEYREHYIDGDLLDNDGTSRIVFPIKCSGDLRTGLGDMTKAETDDQLLFAMLHNPTVWFKHELGVELRPYQADSAACTSRLKVDRWGRRVGKTFHKVGEMLRNMQVGYKDPKTGRTEPMRVLVLAPYQSQVDEIFELIDNLIKGSRNLKTAVDRRRKNPQEITFTNGSRMIGYCTGGDGGASSDKIRGAGGHIIYMDEMDYIPDKHIESVIAIIATASATQMWTTTTPTGERRKFYFFCTDKRMRYKERHVPATASPEWNEETEEVLRLSYSQSGWDHEVLAIWGVVEGGVFPTNKINLGIRPYEYTYLEDLADFKTCIGVDWNGVKAGIPILLVGYSASRNAYVLLDKYISKSEEETQMTGVRDVIAMYDKWNPDYVYLDAGAGATNFELIRSEAKKRGDEKMIRCIKQVHMHSNYDIRDPITKSVIKKQAKSLMVDLAVQRAESDMFIFPESENRKNQLLDQIREFKIDRYTPTGIPIYSQGNEHQLIAWLLAVFGITIEFSDLAKVNGNGALGYTPVGVGRSVKDIDDPEFVSTYEDLIPGTEKFHVESVGRAGYQMDKTRNPGLARSGGTSRRTMGGRLINNRSSGGRGGF